MRFYKMNNCADAGIKCCGVWLHLGSTLIGLAPGWWWSNRSRTGKVFKFGVELFTPAKHYDNYVLFGVEFERFNFKVARCVIGGRYRLSL